MPWMNDPKIDALLQAYNAAISAHHGADRALLDAGMAGQAPTADMLAAEANARADLTNVRDRLLAAVNDAMADHAAAELDRPKTA